MTDYHVLSPSQPDELAERISPPDRSFKRRMSQAEGLLDDIPCLAWHWPLPGHVDDWLGTTDMTRLVSPRIREVLEAHLGTADAIQWLPATVSGSDHEPLQYWVMHFPVWHDVLHETHTSWGPSGLPIRWVLDRAKLSGHAVFIVPKLHDTTIVTDEVLTALRATGATGFDVEAARIA